MLLVDVFDKLTMVGLYILLGNAIIASKIIDFLIIKIKSLWAIGTHFALFVIYYVKIYIFYYENQSKFAIFTENFFIFIYSLFFMMSLFLLLFQTNSNITKLCAIIGLCYGLCYGLKFYRLTYEIFSNESLFDLSDSFPKMILILLEKFYFLMVPLMVSHDFRRLLIQFEEQVCDCSEQDHFYF